MSYSFSVVGKDKADAFEQVGKKFSEVVTQQPVHEIDMGSAQCAAEAFINVLADPSENEEVHVSVSGYVSWRSEGHFTSANISVSAYLKTKE